MASSLHYAPVSPVDTTSHRESIELERVDSDDGPEAALHSPPPSSPTLPLSHSKIFVSDEQMWKLFFPQFWRWLGTVVIIALMIAALKTFENMDYFSHYWKHLFNIVITGISLALGLNFFEAFKGIAQILRWPILANRPHTVREVDLILSIESLSKVVELAWVCRKKISTVLPCVSWLLLNLIAQIAVAIVGLNYSVDSGTDWQGIYLQQGIVNATDLKCFYDGHNCPAWPGMEQTQAHLFGEIASGPPCRNYNDISEILNGNANPLFWCRQTPDKQEYTYRFTELNPTDHARVYPRLTNRTITASSGICFEYAIDMNSGVPTNDLNGNLAAYNWKYSNGTVNGSITIPTAISAWDSTTYLYNGTQIPQEEVESTCGSRCMWMWAFRAFSSFQADQGQNMAVFQCPITVGPVNNVTRDSQMVGDGMAKLAASAIALQGRNVEKRWTQYQLYPWGSTWEIHGHTIDEVGANMASFALGSLAYMATHNPRFNVEGLVPMLGYKLSVHWSYVIEICVSIVFVHFLFFIAAIYMSRRIIIKDDSFLSAARLLRPLVEHLGPTATLLEGKELSKVIEEFVPLGIVYGPRVDKEHPGTFLDIGEEVQPRRRLPTKRHPDGRYL